MSPAWPGRFFDRQCAGAVWTAGQRDNALRCDGVDDRVQCGTWDVAGTGMTLCAWVKLDPAFVDNDARILSKAIGSQEQDHWWMLSTSSSGGERRLRVRLKAGGSTTSLIAGSGNLDLNNWHHVAASYDGAALTLFVNDSLHRFQPSAAGLLPVVDGLILIARTERPDGAAILTPFRARSRARDSRRASGIGSRRVF
ncbi:MAG: LamG domain-containing protein, partial [Chloroflexi bacterium]|nr:LamG domain-containing protein [Chloroflexota bacterium]